MTTQYLTQITTPFGLLPPETQQALREWPYGWELYDGYEWVRMSASNWVKTSTYRAKPEPAIPDQINWEHVAPEWKFMARDIDGDVYLYNSKPDADHVYWFGKGEDLLVTRAFASYTKGTVDWRDSLVVRP